MDLTQELQHLRNAEPEKLGPENTELFKNSIDGLSLSGIVDQSVKVGDRAPGFDLVNQPGQNVRLPDWLRDGAVPNFLNTRIRLHLPQRHYTGVCSYFCRSLFSGLLSHVSRRNTTFLSGPRHSGSVLTITRHGDSTSVRGDSVDIIRSMGGQVPETYERITGVDLDVSGRQRYHGHPGGPPARNAALRQCWEAAVKGIPLLEYAKDHAELAQSIESLARRAEQSQGVCDALAI